MIGQPANFSGIIDGISFRSVDENYAVLWLKVDDNQTAPYCDERHRISLKGPLYHIKVGQRLSIEGVWERDVKYGPQVMVASFTFLELKEISDIIKYLSCNIKYVKGHFSAKIVQTFGLDTFKIIDETPDRLYEISGMGKVRVEGIKAAWIELRHIRDLAVFCTKVGLSQAFIGKINSKYGEKAVPTITEDPYCLARDIFGIGFIKADDVAKNLGIPELSEQRLRAAVVHLLGEHADNNGDVFVYRADLVRETVEFLEHSQIGPVQIEAILDRAIETGIITMDGTRIYQPELFTKEVGIAHALKLILSLGLPPELQDGNLESAITHAITSTGLELHPTQIEAIDRTMRSRCSVITGGPGTGKCLGRGTPILMYDGSVRPVEMVMDGDLVMGPDSRPRCVSGITRGTGSLFRIIPTKGDTWVCNDVHVLTLVRSGTNCVFDIALNDWLSFSAGSRLRQKSKLFRVGVDFWGARYGSDLTEHLSCHPPSISPYVMGVWLGDGSCDTSSITASKPEIIQAITMEASLLRARLAELPDLESNTTRWTFCFHEGNGGEHRTNPILDHFRLCVDANGDKRIIREYLLNAEHLRLQLLAGLIDTDGSLTCNCYEIITKFNGLKEDVLFLARSLGFAAYASPKIVTVKSTGFVGTYWRIMISGNVSRIPVRVPYKQASERCQEKDVRRTGFSIEPIGVGDYFGFQLDGDGRFLLGDFTVTHNTTITKAVVAGYQAAGVPITLLAPTGRASKRMREVIGMGASTIHRRLYALDKAAKKGELTAEQARLSGVIIIDEVSMLDVTITHWLLKYVDPESILVFVGDEDQLPSIGPGSILRDLLASGQVAATRLTHIFRQAEGSDIIRHAHAINKGIVPDISRINREIIAARGWPNTDCFLIQEEDQAKQAKIALWCATAMATHLGFDPRSDVQVLSPMRNGESGIYNLNKILQAGINPNPTDSIRRPNSTWGVGDRLMQLRNNYNLGIFNGDQGTLISITREDGDVVGIVVDFDGVEITIKHNGFNELTLAYATTIHKSQGSETPMVIIVLHTAHFMLLVRNLIFTGWTRGKKRVVLIAHPQAFSMAVHNNKVSKRNTYLSERLGPSPELALAA